MIQVLHILRLVRIHNLFLAALAVLIATSLLDYSISYRVLQCLLIVTITMALGYIMNDVLDIKSDIINHPERPLVNKKLSYKSIIFTTLTLLFSLCIFLSSSLNKISIQFLYYFTIPILISYNLFFKKTPLIGNLLISISLGSIFIFTETVLINSFNQLLLPFLLTFSFSILRETVKDMQDYEGDLSVHMNTLPIFIGMKKMRYLIISWIIILIVALLLPYFFCGYNIKYLLLLIIFIEIPLIYSLFLLIKFPTKKTYKHLADMFKIVCLGGLLVIMVSKIKLYV